MTNNARWTRRWGGGGEMQGGEDEGHPRDSYIMTPRVRKANGRCPPSAYPFSTPPRSPRTSSHPASHRYHRRRQSTHRSTPPPFIG